MPSRTTLHLDDFIEMLERGDDFEHIAHYCGVKPDAIERRFYRNLPKEERDRIRVIRERKGVGVRA